MKNAERLELSLKTVSRMFRDRRYVNITGPTNSTTKTNSLHTVEMSAEYNNPRKLGDGDEAVPEKITCMWFPCNMSVGIKDIQQCCCNVSISCHYILIADSISFHAVAFLVKLPVYFEILSYDDTMYVKTDHVYVPKYTLLTEQETKQIEKKFGPRTSFNRMICKADAIARYMDFREGDVVSVDKYSASGGISTSYRYLINENNIM